MAVSHFGILESVTRMGRVVNFPRSWPESRDKFDEFLPSGRRNPAYVPRASNITFKAGHPLTDIQKSLAAMFGRTPLDRCYRDEHGNVKGRLWYVNRIIYTENPGPIAKKIEDDDEVVW